jgi:predicted ATPase
MKQTKWIVITGPPSSGKTTLIDALQAKGYIVCPEVAREMLMECMKHHIPSKIEAFQRQILSITCRREHFLDTKKTIFFDRGIPDSIAYFRYNALNLKDAITAARFRRYHKVFYCSGLTVIPDGIRKENDETARYLGELILDAYELMHYKPIILPVTSVEERLEIILKNLDASSSAL